MMEGILPIDVLSRWIHVGVAIIVVGGSVFMRYVLMPAAAELPDEPHQALRQRIRDRWKRYVMVGILLLLLSGFYNYLAVAVPRHKGDGLYHGLMGTKILLAFAVFFLGSALTGRSAKLEPIRQNSRKWLTVLILLASLIVMIGGYLKVASPGRPPVAPPLGGESS